MLEYSNFYNEPHAQFAWYERGLAHGEIDIYKPPLAPPHKRDENWTKNFFSYLRGWENGQSRRAYH